MTVTTAHTDSARPRIISLVVGMWRLLSFRQRVALLAALALMAATALSESIVPLLVGAIVNGVATGSYTLDGVVVSLCGVLGVLLFGQVLAVARQQLVESTATAYERDVRIDTLEHALRLPLAFFSSHEVGAVSERMARGIEGSSRLLKLAFMDFLPAVVLALVAIIASFQIGVMVGLAALAVIPLGLVLVRLQIRSQHGVRTTIRDRKERIVGIVVAALPAIAVIRSYGAEAFVSDGANSAARDVRAAEMRHHRSMGVFDIAKFANESIFTMVVLFAAVAAFALHLAPVGSIMASYVLFLKVLAPLREIHRILDESAESGKQAHDLFAFRGEPVDARYNPGGTT